MSNKYLSLEGLSIFYSRIKDWIIQTFAERLHIHDISDINGLQRKLDELTPPPEIETSEYVIIRVNQLSTTVNDLNNTINILNSSINQLNNEIDGLNNTIDMLTPSIGELYITTNNENPSLKFGGIWEQIKDSFLLAAGDIYTAGSVGGESAHILTIDEMPSHTHALLRPQWSRTETTGIETNETAYGVTNKMDTNMYEGTTGNIYETGGGQPHNNMPPYLTVYIWKRIA